jgi:MinD superfamily P-loop ATPase
MKQLVIASGKGGTGKTTVAAVLARLAGPAVTADCDVDAANLALLLSGEERVRRPFYAGLKAEVDPELCIACMLCISACRFGAITLGEGLTAEVDPISCEGCGVCRSLCPSEAVTLRSNLAGSLMVRDTDTGPLVHARLGIAQDNSGKLVAEVREVARAEALAKGLELVLIDGPPGIGCPVHAAITGVDLLLAVTEPTPSGVHDLKRLLALAHGFRLPTAVLINKADLSESYAREVEGLALRGGASLLGRLPFEPQLPGLLAQGLDPLCRHPWAARLQEVWQGLRHMLHVTGKEIYRGVG